MILRAAAEHRQKLVILGGGTAGLLAALAIEKKLGDRYEVCLIRSLAMGVIGVGEGTIPSVVQFLHRFLEIDEQEFHQAVRPSLKLGIRFLWGPRPYFHYTFSGQLMRANKALGRSNGFFCDESFDFADLNAAFMNFERVSLRNAAGAINRSSSFAYHLENQTFVQYLEQLTDERPIQKIDAVVREVKLNELGVSELGLSDGQRVTGDLFLDCSGFQSLLLGQALQEEFENFDRALMCDRAVVGGWNRTHETYHPFTTAETMSSGWCWQIEHDELINRGYVFSSSFISDNQAIAEFQLANPQARRTRIVRFRPGVYRRSWVKNVVAIGNAAGFVEPLEATAIGLICDALLHLVKVLDGSRREVSEIQKTIFNRIQRTNWDLIRDFLALHYRFNTRCETDFWRAARHDVDLGNCQELVDLYQEVGPDLSLLSVELRRDFFAAEGYLAMFVGQQLAYRNRLASNDPSRLKWRWYKSRLAAVAQQGVTMPEYLQAARNGELASNVSNRGNGTELSGEMNLN